MTAEAKADDPLNLLPHAAQAAFNSYDKRHAALCFPDTRTDVLTQIGEWADGYHQRCIFWLNGMAGTGKSTIARTVARKYHTQNQLGASFFFSRGRGDLSNAAKFFTSVAVQLAQMSPALKCCISEAVARNKDIATRALSEQWELLVLGPLTKTEVDSLQLPLLLIIDALDECEDERDVGVILQLLTSASTLTAVQLRILVTSRPETPIRLGFTEMATILHRDLVLNNVPREIIDHDITIYFRQELRDIDLNTQIITRLTEKARGLFIWAATACRFIKNGKRVASKRLSLILEGGKSGKNPEKELDQIYTRILSDSISGDYDEDEKEELFKLSRGIIGTIVALFNPLSADALSKLLKIPMQDVKRTLDDLHSVLEVPESEASPIRLLHPSFRDFLLTRERCEDRQLWVDEKQVHWGLAESCLRLMSITLRRDICGLQRPGTLTTDIERDRVDQYLLPEVQYACLYWVQHLQKSGTQLSNNDQVYKFLREHLLHWLEALSLMQKTPEGILAIIALDSMVGVSEIYSTLRQILADILSPRVVLVCTHLFMMRNGLPYITDPSSRRPLYKYIILPWSSRRRRA